MPPLSLLIKPASSLCNLRCTYCFYHSLAKQRSIENFGIMSMKVMEETIRKAFEYAEDFCSFAFQGGEPTLAGFEFYREFIALQQKYNHKGIKVHFSIQTNGQAINEVWAAFLAEHHFLVGLSLDGPASIHNKYRVDAARRGSFEAVMGTANLFNRFQVEYNILCVVHREVTRRPVEVYRFFKQQGFRFLQFIPCLDPLDQPPGGNAYSLRPVDYGRFLKSLFDEWYRELKKGNIISIRNFDNWLQMLLGYPPESCGMSGQCAGYFVIESNGNVYPCDFYGVDSWLLGNIQEYDFHQLRNLPKAVEFLTTSQPVAEPCQQCSWFSLCRGGCRRNRPVLTDGTLGVCDYCQAYQEFFDYSWERFHELATVVARKYRVKR